MRDVILDMVKFVLEIKLLPNSYSQTLVDRQILKETSIAHMKKDSPSYQVRG